MKLHRAALCVLLCALVMICFAAPSFAVPAARTVSAQPPREEVADPALAARFLNLLNHNFSYDDDFLSVDVLADNAVLALLDTREGDFVRADAVADYLKNFYGIAATDLSGLHPDDPQKDGYVYIVPRGYALYDHSSPKLSLNEDGSYTVTTSVEITAHDGCSTATATSLLVPNENSQFGWVLISSVLSSGRAAV